MPPAPVRVWAWGTVTVLVGLAEVAGGVLGVGVGVGVVIGVGVGVGVVAGEVVNPE